MTRLLVFAIALAAILGFALLTVYAIVEQGGVSIAGLIALVILGFLAVALIGALLGGPRE